MFPTANIAAQNPNPHHFCDNHISLQHSSNQGFHSRGHAHQLHAFASKGQWGPTGQSSNYRRKPSMGFQDPAHMWALDLHAKSMEKWIIQPLLVTIVLIKLARLQAQVRKHTQLHYLTLGTSIGIPTLVQLTISLPIQINWIFNQRNMMALTKSKWAMVPNLPSKTMARLCFLNLISFYVMFCMFQKLPKNYYLFKMLSWNFTLLFFVKDCISGNILHKGPSKNRLYQWSSSPSTTPPSIFSSEHASPLDWHAHLGHPADWILRQVLSRFHLIVMSNKKLPLCSTCRCGKCQ